MSDLKITCPKCSSEIELTESLAGPMMADMKVQFAAQLEAKRHETEQAVKAAEQRAKAAAEQAGKQNAQELAERLADREAKLTEAQAAQAAAMKRERELADKEAEIELTIQKQLAVERETLHTKLAVEAEQKAALRMSEQSQTIEGLTRKIEELQQRATQGSMQTQGEAAELVLEGMLGTAFPLDMLEPVGKGVSGADVAQVVGDGRGGAAGTILWESKRTKNWSPAWLAKLREDQRKSGAHIAVLVSTALPHGVQSFDLIDGIWVCGPSFAVPLARSLRQGLLDVSTARGLKVGQQSKMELVYDYLTGTQFKQRIEAVHERFSVMEDALRKERIFMEKQWALRQKQLELVQSSMLGVGGDLKAIAGASMPEIGGLDLKVIGNNAT